ncbi:phosphodiester glycosidase family protein [Vibrio mangrovi]|uniref:Phosphodiester glycosidase family protein n=1 Tax=Vibrio mangrovi TaxID=474394 RepID=A0A1Y6IWZ8_9VIBR|nr:phosphodiester glycosidase family protein [Vibrio mangrovi]MDW6005383.1 phosphodiester glycosidase family protein [Vibrio mangrovi]SMS02177.1 hypothetical protein VIM7927_03495 [Vibrio mangrovi]
MKVSASGVHAYADSDHHTSVHQSQNRTTDSKIFSATLIQKFVRGHFARQQVSVGTEAPGITRTTIQSPQQSSKLLAEDGTPLKLIQENLKPGATYNRLTIQDGARTLNVLGTQNGELPVNPKVQAQKASLNSAIINGGYFVHVPNKETDSGEKIQGIGRTVGPTGHRDDHTPVPNPWKQDYRTIKSGDDTLLTSGPLLYQPGEEKPSFDDDRFRYRLNTEQGVITNPLNIRAGAMTSDNNERAAISLEPNGDIRMHTATAEGNKKLSPTIEQWQSIAMHGAAPQSAILNVDGGGSVFMGVQTPDGIKQVSRGGKPDTEIRPIPNILTSRVPTQAEKEDPALSRPVYLDKVSD